MRDKPRDEGAEPSLELPSLFRRRRPLPSAAAPRTAAEPPPVAPPPEPAAPAPEPARAPAPEAGQDRELKLPPVPARAAAAVTGAVVGLLAALLTWGSLEGCEQLKGTDSCGGEGFFLLLMVLALMIVAGALLLAAWDVADPRSTSALGVALVCIVVLLLLMEELFDAWMFAVVPAVSALAYLAAHWVTTALVDESEPERGRPAGDVR